MQGNGVLTGQSAQNEQQPGIAKLQDVLVGQRSRIGADGLFATQRQPLMFNGYEQQVGQLYAGMDLRKFY